MALMSGMGGKRTLNWQLHSAILTSPAVLPEMRNTFTLVRNKHWLKIVAFDQSGIAKVKLDELTPIDRQSTYFADALTYFVIRTTAARNHLA